MEGRNKNPAKRAAASSEAAYLVGSGIKYNLEYWIEQHAANSSHAVTPAPLAKLNAARTIIQTDTGRVQGMYGAPVPQYLLLCGEYGATRTIIRTDVDNHARAAASYLDNYRSARYSSII